MNQQESEPRENAPATLGGGEEIRAELGLSAPRGAPRGWYSRGYLPHYNNPETIQSVTFRLADALPQSKLREIENELAESPAGKIDAERRKKIEAWLDAGLGCCALRQPSLASIMQETLLKWDGERYRLCAWCIMPNHLHVLMETHVALSKIVQSWKSFTGRWEKMLSWGSAFPGRLFGCVNTGTATFAMPTISTMSAPTSRETLWQPVYANKPATGGGRALPMEAFPRPGTLSPSSARQ